MSTVPPADAAGRAVAGDPATPSPVDYRALFEEAPCGYLTTRDDGTVTGVNETFLRWTGHTEVELLGTQLPRLFPVGDRVLWSTHCRPLLALVGAVAEIAVEVVTATGTRLPALVSAARSATGDRGEPVVRVIVFGAHERRRYEKELLAARRDAQASDAQRADAEAHLAHQALHDVLTGLPNASALLAHLERIFSDAGGAPGVGVLHVDLDHFKAVNDSLGRPAGDELLLAVARRLRAGVPDDALVAHLGGDEFVVVVPALGDGASEPGAPALVGLARRLLSSLRAPVSIDGVEIEGSASIGCAVARPGSDSPERLLRHADIAMYRAKGRGRSTWQLHDPAVSDPTSDRLRLIGDLRRGIDRGELRVHYQPRICLADGRLHSVEALVRWEHPTRGLLAPVHFIEVAEESGLVRGLGAHVLDEATRQAVAWRDAGQGGGTVETSVNLSARQLLDPHVVTVVAGILDRHGLDPAMLTLEITETALMTDPDAALQVLTSLKALGVQLAVDDFGTGYASFTYLRRFPVDELKIDRSFVSGLGTSAGDSAIVASCVQLAHAIGIRAVAEGVETEEQRRALVALGCDQAQGYLFSRPVPADELGSWLDAAVEAPGVGGGVGVGVGRAVPSIEPSPVSSPAAAPRSLV